MISIDSILEFFEYASELKLYGISLLNLMAFFLTFFFILLTKNIFRKFLKKKLDLYFKKKNNEKFST